MSAEGSACAAQRARGQRNTQRAHSQLNTLQGRSEACAGQPGPLQCVLLHIARLHTAHMLLPSEPVATVAVRPDVHQCLCCTRVAGVCAALSVACAPHHAIIATDCGLRPGSGRARQHAVSEPHCNQESGPRVVLHPSTRSGALRCHTAPLGMMCSTNSVRIPPWKHSGLLSALASFASLHDGCCLMGARPRCTLRATCRTAKCKNEPLCSASPHTSHHVRTLNKMCSRTVGPRLACGVWKSQAPLYVCFQMLPLAYIVSSACAALHLPVICWEDGVHARFPRHRLPNCD
jgi:hypothetical protein